MNYPTNIPSMPARGINNERFFAIRIFTRPLCSGIMISVMIDSKEFDVFNFMNFDDPPDYRSVPAFRLIT